MKFLKSLTIATVVLSSMASLAQNASAADADGTGSNVPSFGTIKLIADDSATGPLDPANPDVPVTPDPNGPKPGDKTPGINVPTGEIGPLSIDSVPNLDFGTVSVKNSTMKVKNALPFLQVTDNRGTGEGWGVNAEMSDLAETSTGQTLTGVELTFQQPNFKKKTENTSSAPTIGSAVVLKPTAAGATSNAVKMFSAAKDQGLGTWLAVYSKAPAVTPKAPAVTPKAPAVTPKATGEDLGTNESIVLSIPGSTARVGSYESTITWTLATTPTAP